MLFTPPLFHPPKECRRPKRSTAAAAALLRVILVVAFSFHFGLETVVAVAESDVYCYEAFCGGGIGVGAGLWGVEPDRSTKSQTYVTPSPHTERGLSIQQRRQHFLSLAGHYVTPSHHHAYLRTVIPVKVLHVMVSPYRTSRKHSVLFVACCTHRVVPYRTRSHRTVPHRAVQYRTIHMRGWGGGQRKQQQGEK